MSLFQLLSIHGRSCFTQAPVCMIPPAIPVSSSVNYVSLSLEG